MVNTWTQGLAWPLRWRRNGHGGVSNHQPHDCLLNRLFGCRSKKTSKLRVTFLCAGNSPGTREFPAQMASNAENVSIWWRHQAESENQMCWSLAHCWFVAGSHWFRFPLAVHGLAGYATALDDRFSFWTHELWNQEQIKPGMIKQGLVEIFVSSTGPFAADSRCLGLGYLSPLTRIGIGSGSSILPSIRDLRVIVDYLIDVY